MRQLVQQQARSQTAPATVQHATLCTCGCHWALAAAQSPPLAPASLSCRWRSTHCSATAPQRLLICAPTTLAPSPAGILRSTVDSSLLPRVVTLTVVPRMASM